MYPKHPISCEHGYINLYCRLGCFISQTPKSEKSTNVLDGLKLGLRIEL